MSHCVSTLNRELDIAQGEVFSEKQIAHQAVQAAIASNAAGQQYKEEMQQHVNQIMRGLEQAYMDGAARTQQQVRNFESAEWGIRNDLQLKSEQMEKDVVPNKRRVGADRVWCSAVENTCGNGGRYHQ